MEKVLKIIDSCKTKEQLRAAFNVVCNYTGLNGVDNIVIESYCKKKISLV